MALPTTPTLTAASTASGKTQNTSMRFKILAFGRPDHDSPRLQIQLRNVLQRKGNVEIAAIAIAYHENLVGGGLEGVAQGTDNPTRVVDGGQSDEVSHVEFVLFRRVEIVAL